MLYSFAPTALKRLQENCRELIRANVLMEGQVAILRAKFEQFNGQQNSLRIIGLQDGQDRTAAVAALLDIGLDPIRHFHDLHLVQLKLMFGSNRQNDLPHTLHVGLHHRILVRQGHLLF